MSRTKSAVKSTAKKGPMPAPKLSMDVLKLENNVPLPKKGVRDPEFVARAVELLKQIKIKQSFVVPKNKVHTLKKLNKTDFEHLALRTSLIKPDNQFARVWRIK